MRAAEPVRGGKCARALCQALGVALGVALLTPVAHAAVEKERVALPDAPKVPSLNKRPTRRGPIRRGPRLTLQQFITVKSQQVENARQRVIDRLLKIIQRTPKSDADYPEYLYRLGLLYEERARFYFNRGMRQDDGPVPTDPRVRAKQERQKKSDLAQSRIARKDTLKVWAQIYKEFPDYKHADRALYNLSDNLTKLGFGKKALQYYTALIKRYSKSPLVPDAFLAIGEYYFDNDDMKTALKAYKRVAFFTDSRLYGFALYKQAWCYYNLGDYKTSMRRFIEVIRFGEAAGSSKNKLDLHNESKRELILAYSHAAPATNAEKFFTNVPTKGGAKYYQWVKPRLANLYFDQGKFHDAIYMYKILIKERLGTYDAVKFSLQVVRAQLAIGGRHNVSRQVFALIDAYGAMKMAKPEERAKARKDTEEMIRGLAITYHRDAMKLKSKDVYALAADLYKAYVKAFGVELKHSYEMKFFLGELLYTSSRWSEAAEQYLAVAQGNPNGKYARKAVYAAIVALHKMLNEDKLAGSRTTLDRKGKVPPPKPISGLLQKMAAACELYLKVASAADNEKAPACMYRLARIYYEAYHFDRAAGYFEQFLNKYPKHELAVSAGHGLLDSLNALKDFQRLALWGGRLLQSKNVQGNKILKAEVAEVTQGATLKNIDRLTQAGKHKEAAAAYSSFISRYPNSAYLAKVLHNAATAYQKIGKPKVAIEMRERLVRKFPHSKMAAPAMLAIGQMYHHQGIYSLAAAYYEALSQAHGALDGADKALFAAALFREGGGEYAKAIKNLENYIRRYGKNRRGKDVADKYFRIGLLLEKQSKWKKLRTHFQRFLKTFPANPDQKLAALWRIAWANYKLMRRKNDKKLWKLFDEVIKVYNRLSTEQRRALTRGRAAVAQARFQQAEILFRKFSKMRLTNPRKIKKQLGAKARALRDAGVAFYDVIRFKQAEWAIAAYARTGQIFQRFAKSLVDSPVPRRLPERLRLLYKEELQNRAVIIEGKAKEGYEKSLATSRELKVYTKWTKLAETQLSVLMPQKYALANEIKIQPTFAVDPDPAKGTSSYDQIRAYQKVLENDLTNTTAMNNLGILLRRTGKWQDAVQQFRRALTVDPKNIDAYRNLAWTYYSIGKYDLAHLVSLNAERLLKKQDPGILNNWGLIYLKRNEVAKALSQFKRALKENGEFVPALMNFGALALNYSDYPTAEEMFRKALNREDRNVSAQLGMALALRGNRRYPEAREKYEKALEVDSRNRMAHFNLAILYQEFLSKPQKAIDSFQRFVQLASVNDKFRAEAETRIKNLQQLLAVLKKEKG